MKKPITVIIILLSILVLLANSTLMAAELKHTFEIGAGTIAGETEYEINGYNPNYGNFKSLLVFPLDVEIVTLNYKNNYTSQTLNIGGIEFKYSRNINDQAGTFKDSDWFELTGIHIKDILGETKTKADKIEKIDFRIHSGWQPLNYNLNYTLYLGYERDNYQLTAYDGVQRYLTDTVYFNKGEQETINGDAVDYEAVYNIPYLGAAVKTNNKRDINLSAAVFYSRWVKMEDRDHHLKRDLVLEGEGEGNSLLVDLNLSYNMDLSKKIFLNIKYNNTEVDGTQTQYTTAGVYEGVNYSAKQESAQYEMGFGVDF